MRRDTVLALMLVMAVLGLGVATYQTYEHYAKKESSVCDISESLSCSTVTSSRFGVFPPSASGGIPVAFYGMIWWLGFIVLLGAQRWEESGIADITERGLDALQLDVFGFDNLDFATFTWLVVGLGTIVYLLWVELVALPAETGEIVICPFCTVQHVLIVIAFGLSFFILEKPVREYISDVVYTEG